MTKEQIIVMNKTLDKAIALGEGRVKRQVEDIYWSMVSHRIRYGRMMSDYDLWWNKWIEKRLERVLWGI